MNKKNMIFIAVALVVIIGGAFGAKYLSDLSAYRQAIDEIDIGDINLGGIEDGVYSGYVDTVWVGATVFVTVENEQITAIELEHRHDRGEAAEVIPGRVIEAQSLKVDLVSGATNSCKVILKAIENALLQAAR